jgi:hypothetical protein
VHVLELDQVKKAASKNQAEVDVDHVRIFLALIKIPDDAAAECMAVIEPP